MSQVVSDLWVRIPLEQPTFKSALALLWRRSVTILLLYIAPYLVPHAQSMNSVKQIRPESEGIAFGRSDKQLAA